MDELIKISCQNYFVLIVAILRARALTINKFRRRILYSVTQDNFFNLVLLTSFNKNVRNISMALSFFRARTPVFVHAVAVVIT